MHQSRDCPGRIVLVWPGRVTVDGMAESCAPGVISAGGFSRAVSGACRHKNRNFRSSLVVWQ
jgi:hypothetical protein